MNTFGQTNQSAVSNNLGRVDQFLIVRQLDSDIYFKNYLAENRSNGQKLRIQCVRNNALSQKDGLHNLKSALEKAQKLEHLMLDSHRTFHRCREIDQRGQETLGISENSFILISDYLSGTPLPIWKEQFRSAIPYDECIKFATPIAEAMDIAHKKGVFHGNLTPESIMISRKSDNAHVALNLEATNVFNMDTPGAVIRIRDFGVSAGLRQSYRRISGNETIEKVNDIHRSPESASGKAFSAASDQFSFAAILFEMMTGQDLASTNKTPQQNALEYKGESLTDSQKQVFAKALQPSPSKRFRTCTAFIKALSHSKSKGFSENFTLSLLPWPIILKSTALVLIAAIGVWMFFGKKAPETTAETAAAQAKTEAEIHVSEGKELLKQNKFSEAIKKAQQALQKYPDFPPAKTLIAQINVFRKQPKAEEVLQSIRQQIKKLTAVSPDNGFSEWLAFLDSQHLEAESLYNSTAYQQVIDLSDSMQPQFAAVLNADRQRQIVSELRQTVQTIKQDVTNLRGNLEAPPALTTAEKSFTKGIRLLEKGLPAPAGNSPSLDATPFEKASKLLHLAQNGFKAAAEKLQMQMDFQAVKRLFTQALQKSTRTKINPETIDNSLTFFKQYAPKQASPLLQLHKQIVIHTQNNNLKIATQKYKQALHLLPELSIAADQAFYREAFREYCRKAKEEFDQGHYTKSSQSINRAIKLPGQNITDELSTLRIRIALSQKMQEFETLEKQQNWQELYEQTGKLIKKSSETINLPEYTALKQRNRKAELELSPWIRIHPEINGEKWKTCHVYLNDTLLKSGPEGFMIKLEKKEYSIKIHENTSVAYGDFLYTETFTPEANGLRIIKANAKPVAAPVKGINWRSSITDSVFIWLGTPGIWVGRDEITNRAYRKLNASHKSGEYNGHTLDSDNQPVVNISFKDAVDYAYRLTRKEQIASTLPYSFSYQLPTDSQWTELADCGDNRKYPWGNELPPYYGNYSDISSAWNNRITNYDDSYPVTCPVEKSGTNPLGLNGIGGNVWEMITDKKGDCEGIRGAAWNYYYHGYLTCDYKKHHFPTQKDPSIGFRLILSEN